MNFIKKSFLGKILYLFRDIYNSPHTLFLLFQIRKMPSRSCILLGTPTFNNIGDHLIAISELEFLRDCFPEYKIFEIPTQIYMRLKSRVSHLVPKNIPVFITGGGWMGSLWPNDEYIMQDMIKTFREHAIVIFPQTIYYDLNNLKFKKILKDANGVYKKCKNLKVCLREKDSYQFALEFFDIPKDNIYIMPDMALYYKKEYEKKNLHKSIIICMRKDREKLSHVGVNDWIKKYSLTNKIKIEEVDTVQISSIPVWKRRSKVKYFIKKFGKSELIITDRLHGMLIAVIAKTKCIVFNNTTNKVYGVYNKWITKNPNIKYLEGEITYADFISAVDNMLIDDEIHYFNRKEITEAFECLNNIVRRS